MNLRDPQKRTPTDAGYQVTALIGRSIPHHQASWWIEWNGKKERIYWRGSNAGTAVHDTLKFWRDFLVQHATWV